MTDQGSPLPRRPIPGVANVIGVASGKGGVGKSTVSVNLACALQQRGARVGLMDADMYGPSIPMMMDAFEEIEGDAESRKLIPLERYGVKLVSIGFLNPGGDPIIWRGPIVSRALQQLINDADWGTLDYLLVDLPPGTGDAPLTLAQAVPLSGVLIVFTPQDVALNIAAKSLAMFQRPPFEVPILGMVENMSSFVCPHCSHETDVFGKVSAQRISSDFGVSLLGSIPLSSAVRESGDLGRPIVVADPESAQAAEFRKIAGEVDRRVRALKEAASEKKSGAFLGLERLFTPRKKPAGPQAAGGSVMSGLRAEAQPDRIVLRWNGPASATYRVKRAPASGGPYQQIAADLKALTFTDASVANQQTYYYVVSARQGENESDSEEVSARLPSPG